MAEDRRDDPDGVDGCSGTCTAPVVNGSGCVLVVDDDPGVRVVLGRALARCGYEVFLAENGAQALATLDHQPEVFAIVSDLTMPLMSGAQLATEVLRRHPGKPILFVTSSAADPVLLAHPLIGQVRKPVMIESVRRALADLIDAARAMARTAAESMSPDGAAALSCPAPAAVLSGVASPPAGG